MTCSSATNVTSTPQPQVLLVFPAAQAARDYRHINNTGGIIFTNSELTVLFPPNVTPIGIFNHPLTRGKEGKLLRNLAAAASITTPERSFQIGRADPLLGVLMNSSHALQAKPIKVVATMRNGRLAVENFLTIAEAYAACDRYEAGGHEATMPDYSQSSAGAP